MAFGSTSSVFREWNVMTLQVSGTGYTGLDSDTVKVSLHNNSVTPDKDAAVTSTGFNTGTWTTTNEVTDATNWVSGGRALASKTFTTPATGVCMFDAADLAGGGNVTITNAYGCLVYDDSITAGTIRGPRYHPACPSPYDDGASLDGCDGPTRPVLLGRPRTR